MKTIVMINNKGGVGKTNSVTAISHILSQRLNKRVLMVDLDPQMNMTSMFCDVDFIDLFSNLYNGSMEKAAPSVEDLLMDSGMLGPHNSMNPKLEGNSQVFSNLLYNAVANSLL